MTKKVNFSTKPRAAKETVTPDEWVSSGGRAASAETPATTASRNEVQTTRFTIDIPVELHARIKSECAIRRVKMRDEIQSLLEKHFGTENN